MRSSIILSAATLVQARNNLAKTPPMGWMSWEIFRCNLASKTDNCTDKTSTMCISEALYQGQADAMVSQGFASSGYASIHMDVSFCQFSSTVSLLLNQFLPVAPLFIAGLLGGKEPPQGPSLGGVGGR